MTDINLQIDLEEAEAEILNGGGEKYYKSFRKRIVGDLTILNGATEAIFSQLKLAFQFNEPVASYLFGRFRKDKACYLDLQDSVYFWVASSTDRRTIDFLKVLSGEIGPGGKSWCAECIKTIQSKIDVNQLDSQ